MTDPYRDSTLAASGEAPRDAGIVGDVIAQFADPLAFYRELVQNAIDAGSPSVDVELEYDEPAQRMRIAVRDRGEGMTREIVEQQLFVLFRSTKERDPTKIGKFGIGFSSVLAPKPEVVAVHTARDGRRLTAHLYRDLHYDLFDAGPATGHGTTVELELAMERRDVAELVRDSERSLVRWCRHAAVPITLHVRVPDDTSTRRIDRPLAVEHALVEARRVTDGGQLTVIVALLADAASYAGFFNHGLMLYETDAPLAGKVAVKIQDARLGHTISRDDVRRDAHFARAVAVAQEVVELELRQAIGVALREAAEAHALPRHGALLEAIGEAELALGRERLHFPLVEPLAGKRSLCARDLGADIWTARASSALTASLAAARMPVLLADEPAPIARVLDAPVRVATDELTSITPIEHTDDDDLLIAILRELFAAVHRPPDGIVLATLCGAREDRLAIAAGHEAQSVVDRDEAGRDPFALLRRRVLVLSVEHPQVRAARSGDPAVAASHLARVVLLEHRLLTQRRSRAIVEHALARVGVTT